MMDLQEVYGEGDLTVLYFHPNFIPETVEAKRI
jgi:hypothetical protein